MPLIEVGHEYSYVQEPLMVRFDYTACHVQSGQRFAREVWTWSRNTFEALLSHWNRDDRWRYRPGKMVQA